ncbi:MAG: thioredoxin family protein [Bacteroidota bacterium]
MKLISIILLSVIVLELSAQNTNITSLYEGPFEDVVKESKKSKRLIFLDFTSKSCKSCLKMEQEAFANKAIAEKLNDDYIVYKVNIEDLEGRKLIHKYEIREFPAYIILDSETKIKGKILGFYQAHQFLKEINRLAIDTSQIKPIKRKRKLFG